MMGKIQKNCWIFFSVSNFQVDTVDLGLDCKTVSL
jgi:hypothetical protein